MTCSPIIAGLFAASFGASSLFATLAGAEETPRLTSPDLREIEIVVDGGYKPARIVITQGERVRLKLIRRDYSPCTREIVFASLGIRRELPTDVPVVIELPALSPGEVQFKCGMSMLRGVIVVEPSQ